MSDDLARSVTLIANPAAGRGRGSRVLPAVRAAFTALGARVVVTECAGDERRLARQALDAGATTIAALGGDGTWSNVAGAIVESRGDCALAPIDAGTGSDWVKTLGVPATDPVAMAALVAAGRASSVDAGAVDDGGATRYFVNVASFGFAAAATAVAQRTRWLRGDSLYLYAALTQLFGYRGFSLGIDEVAEPLALRAPQLLLAVGVGRHFGGRFAIAPEANPRDGLLDLVAIADASARRRVSLFAAATRGRHVHAPEVGTWRAAEATLRFDAPPCYEADGELRQAASATVTVRCLAGAVRVVGA